MQSDNVVSLRPAEEKREKAQGEEATLFQGIACEAPPCPAWLSKDAKKHYRFICTELKKAGLIAKIDQGALAILCTSYARMKEAEEMLQERGSEYQETPNGYSQLAPEAIQWERHSNKYEKLAKQFGITIRARQNVRVENPNQAELEL
ncbi:phage terminase small subunit P27 family [uncultured Microbulbifer sp.]|uniref:phage terminase small subunit P27 family n=1 Tax=uncultured Microbulbifer sp. TaxID=348147 RepID=UPI0026146648|nr:phage terminase small subunit P27 family [uncultured Microbulbifer sp.]